MNKILITGGTGLVGTRLTKMLLEKGYEVSYLSRKKENIENVKVFRWDISRNYIEEGALENADFIVHLAGAGIADKRWTEARKKEIIESRTKPIELIFSQLATKDIKIKSFISASAIGFYGGDTGENLIDENSTNGNDFLAECTRKWETSPPTPIPTERGVILRIGIVLSKEGGALPKLILPIKYGIGSPLGSGKQWMSWIHIDDVCRLFLKAIEDEKMNGIYNAVAPNPIRNEEITKISAKILKKPLWLPNIPSFVLKLLFGEMSVVVLGGNHVLNKRISEETDFKYQFSEVEMALEDLLKKLQIKNLFRFFPI